MNRTEQQQRRFSIGFNRAGRIIDQLHKAGVVGPAVGTKPRKVLMTMEEFEAMLHGEETETVDSSSIAQEQEIIESAIIEKMLQQWRKYRCFTVF